MPRAWFHVPFMNKKVSLFMSNEETGETAISPSFSVINRRKSFKEKSSHSEINCSRCMDKFHGVIQTSGIKTIFFCHCHQFMFSTLLLFLIIRRSRSSCHMSVGTYTVARKNLIITTVSFGIIFRYHQIKKLVHWGRSSASIQFHSSS